METARRETQSEPTADDERLWALLREDWATYEGDVTEGGLWLTLVQRVARRVERQPAPVRRPLGACLHGLSTLGAWTFGITLPKEVELGRRVRIWHVGAMRLCARAIGDDVHLRPNTNLGAVPGTEDTPENWPVIERGVDVGSGACVLGPVHIGRDAMVGANTFVLEDVPSERSVLGVPGRLLPKKRGSGRAFG